MFKKLTTFSYKRNIKEAIGFYIAYIFLTFLISILLVIIINSTLGSLGNIWYNIGRFLSVVIPFTLSFLIIKSKNLFKKFFHIILFLFSGIIMTYFNMGIFILMLIPTILSTISVYKETPK